MRVNDVTKVTTSEAGSETPADDSEVCGAAAREEEHSLVTRLVTEVGQEADLRHSDLVKKIISTSTIHEVQIVSGFVATLPNGNEYNFCHGERYSIRLIETRTIGAAVQLADNKIGYYFGSVENIKQTYKPLVVRDIEVIAKHTMSHEHPPANLTVHNVWYNCLSFVTEDE